MAPGGWFRASSNKPELVVVCESPVSRERMMEVVNAIMSHLKTYSGGGRVATGAGPMSRVIPVILCGGSGTRLWPLSRSDRPKQLISLGGDHTLLEGTLLRARTIAGAGDPICVTAAAYGAEVRQSLDRLGLRGRLLLEPEPRNTAPALCCGSPCCHAD